jgi:hypothetical protein
MRSQQALWREITWVDILYRHGLTDEILVEAQAGKHREVLDEIVRSAFEVADRDELIQAVHPLVASQIIPGVPEGHLKRAFASPIERRWIALCCTETLLRLASRLPLAPADELLVMRLVAERQQRQAGAAS